MTSDGREDHARAGLEHLQAAALEVIQATRSLLDAAEELVEDPAAVQGMVTSLTAVAQAAAARLRSNVGGGSGDGGADGDGDGRVQRIRVS